MNRLEQVFEKYNYHSCISTWTGKAIVEDTNIYFMLTTANKTIIISDVPYIIIDNKVYQLGYWGNVKINKLIDELKDLFES